jgi:hypothetical protein
MANYDIMRDDVAIALYLINLEDLALKETVRFLPYGKPPKIACSKMFVLHKRGRVGRHPARSIG